MGSGGRRSHTEQTPTARGFWSFWTTLPGVLTGVAAVVTAIVGLVTLWHGLSWGASAPGAPSAFSISLTCRGTTVTVDGRYPTKYEGKTVFFVFDDVVEHPGESRNLPDAPSFETSFDVARFLADTRHITVRVDNTEDIALAKAETDCRQ